MSNLEEDIQWGSTTAGSACKTTTSTFTRFTGRALRSQLRRLAVHRQEREAVGGYRADRGMGRRDTRRVIRATGCPTRSFGVCDSCVWRRRTDCPPRGDPERLQPGVAPVKEVNGDLAAEAPGECRARLAGRSAREGPLTGRTETARRRRRRGSKFHDSVTATSVARNRWVEDTARGGERDGLPLRESRSGMKTELARLDIC